MASLWLRKGLEPRFLAWLHVSTSQKLLEALMTRPHPGPCLLESMGVPPVVGIL